MPTKLRELAKMLKAAGYEFDHATGSHYTYKHLTRGSLTIPFHGNNVGIRPGTLKNIWKQAGLNNGQVHGNDRAGE